MRSVDPLSAAMSVAVTGLKAQGARVRVVAENLANANSTASTPGGDPYRRKTVTFDSLLNREEGWEGVAVRKIGVDRSDFRRVYDPSHQAADADGYVKLPNVNSVIEINDMREATRSYEAGLNVIEQSRSMRMRTIDMLRG